ncbi:hypothetical protein PFICI_11434 [Pestalotiopsis fici W106-1]|uniref:Uncharacterized protein n=1 Tax=Pestalotiopsis fici (strain W106-1 / CGMCC3.15140) TaxID=1229662 RepID=W3WUP1_PESFW|nr:uncharacterized protein PFICI_11434 [Pestalotiopsis fici W106-1]ETS77560.1 hypothetical protein PFICI_11434 [Pestalotiopsis fici W106-1]
MSVAAEAEGSTSNRSRRPRRSHTVPDRGSLWDVMHDHQGTSLFVLPLCWTDMHTRLLGCRFVRQPSQDTPVPSTHSSPRTSPPASLTLVAIGRDIDTLMTRDNPRNVVPKTRALRNIMSTLFPIHLGKPKANAELSLRFGGRLYQKAARAQVLWKHHDATMSFDSATTWTSSRNTSQLLASMSVNIASDAPILAYVSRSNLNHIRHNCFRIVQGPNRNPNIPVHRLQTLRSKNLVPSNLDEDPYFVATAISLAQQHFYPDGHRTNQIKQRDVTVRLFTISEEDQAFIVYTAKISSEFLMMFHSPESNPKPDATNFRIEYKHVPVWPILGLKERLGQALGEELVGNIDPLSMETFPDDEEEIFHVNELTPPKRRLDDVFSEVLNASFIEDPEPSSTEEMGVIGEENVAEDAPKDEEEELEEATASEKWHRWAKTAAFKAEKQRTFR